VNDSPHARDDKPRSTCDPGGPNRRIPRLLRQLGRPFKPFAGEGITVTSIDDDGRTTIHRIEGEMAVSQKMSWMSILLRVAAPVVGALIAYWALQQPEVIAFIDNIRPWVTEQWNKLKLPK
jgi:hypothetical protein